MFRLPCVSQGHMHPTHHGFISSVGQLCISAADIRCLSTPQVCHSIFDFVKRGRAFVAGWITIHHLWLSSWKLPTWRVCHIQLLKILSAISPVPIHVWHKATAVWILLTWEEGLDLLLGLERPEVIYVKMPLTASVRLLKCLLLPTLKCAQVLNDSSILAMILSKPGNMTFWYSPVLAPRQNRSLILSKQSLQIKEFHIWRYVCVCLHECRNACVCMFLMYLTMYSLVMLTWPTYIHWQHYTCQGRQVPLVN